MSKYTDKSSSNLVICPYCEHSFQPDGDDISQDGQTEECGECGKKFRASAEYSVTFTAVPDCELNDEQHDWEILSVSDDYFLCSICDAYKRAEKTK